MKAYMFIVAAYGIFLLVELYALVRLLTQYIPPVKRVKITFRINVVIFCTGISMLAVVLLFDINYVQYESPIPYANWKNIGMKDFRGLKRPGQTLDGQKDFAFIVSSTEVTESGDGFEITTYFHPARSYVYNSDISSPKLLRHEMYHFHVREYCARLLRKKFAFSKEPITPDKAQGMNTDMEIFEDSLQFKYDDESYHGYVAGKQLMWEKRIDSCLKSTEEYVNPYIKPGSKAK